MGNGSGRWLTLQKITMDAPELQSWPIGQIIPLPDKDNPRVVSQAGIDLLTKTMSDLGDLLPITVNRRTGHILSGNQRFKVHVASGIETLEVWTVDVPEESEPLVAIALNRHAANFDSVKLTGLIMGVLGKGVTKDRLAATLLPASRLNTLTKKFEDQAKRGAELANAATSGPAPDPFLQQVAKPATSGNVTTQVNISTAPPVTKSSATTKKETVTFRLTFSTLALHNAFKERLFSLKNNDEQYDGQDYPAVLLNELKARV